MHSHTYAGL